MNLSNLKIENTEDGYYLYDGTSNFPWPSLDAVKYDIQEECLGYRTFGLFPFCKTEADAWKLAKFFNKVVGKYGEYEIEGSEGSYWAEFDGDMDFFPWTNLTDRRFDLQEQCLGYRSKDCVGFPYCNTEKDVHKLVQFYNNYDSDVVVIKLSGREVAAWNGELLAFNCAVTPEQIYDIFKMLNL